MGVAVAKFETGWQNITGPTVAGSTMRGMWQISWDVHPEVHQFGDWRDPYANAKMAHSIWQAAGGSWSPWSTYNSAAAYLRAHGQQVPNTQPGTAAAAPCRRAGQTPGQGPVIASDQVGGYRVVSGVRIPIPTGPAGVAINYALNQVGKPYVWAAHGPNAYDCSGLTSEAWKAAGVNVYPQSEVQDSTLQHVPLDQARPGDIAWHPGHVQLVLGVIGGKWTVVEAANPRAGIRVDQSGWMHPQAILRP